MMSDPLKETRPFRPAHLRSLFGKYLKFLQTAVLIVEGPFEESKGKRVVLPLEIAEYLFDLGDKCEFQSDKKTCWLYYFCALPPLTDNYRQLDIKNMMLITRAKLGDRILTRGELFALPKDSFKLIDLDSFYHLFKPIED